MSELDQEYRPRLTISISEDQANDLRELVPWGLKNKLFQPIVQQIIEGLKKDPETFIAAMLMNKLRFGVRSDEEEQK